MQGSSFSELVGGELNDIEKKFAPKEIFYSGNAAFLSEERRVSVVGSRKVSSNGARRAAVITRALVNHGITVVSGLAEGVDTVAHKTTIENGGKTIAVLGTPLAKVYPKSNYDLLETIKEKHLAISQFPEGYPSQRQNFPMRNRTMALISDATIIVEASENSGTRHQGWEALRLGRLVYIMQNIVDDSSITWAQEMIGYGAQVLTKENLENVLLDIPSLTNRESFAF